MGIKGVKRRPSKNEDGDRLLVTEYAIVHGTYFAILKNKQGHNGHSMYAVIKLNKGGPISKIQVKGLCDKQYQTQGDAKDAIRQWDLGYTK